jgi:hypothetical protein
LTTLAVLDLLSAWPHDAPLDEVIELDPAQDDIDDPGQGLRDNPADYQDDQENQNLRDRVDDRIEQVLGALTHVNRSQRLVHAFPPLAVISRGDDPRNPRRVPDEEAKISDMRSCAAPRKLPSHGLLCLSLLTRP